VRDLKEKAIRGGFAKVVAQVIILPLRVGSLMILARLLDPRDFGLVGMVTAVTGVFSLFKDFGLSTATVQRATVTEDQVSTLFWINMLVGGILCLLSFASAPLVAMFYREPRLSSVMAALAIGFVFNAAGVQHSVQLQRQMRFTALAAIDIASLFLSICVGIVMALTGFGYWALVATTLVAPLAATVGFWIMTRWIPGRPRRNVGIRSMMRFGGTLTLNGLVVYVAYNLEKVLLGRFWGATTVGLYGRAYQLITIPTDNLNSAVGGVAFSSLSRVQHDPERLKNYFLKGYALVLALTVPVTAACLIMGDDLILVVLGPKWTDAAVIFRLLAPTILIFALINPMAWLLFALGMVGRSLKVALVLAPLVIAGYLIGLPYGPKGVAFGYSAMMTLWVVPHIAWCVHGTVISLKDIARVVSRPLVSSLVGGALAFGALYQFGSAISPLCRLILGGTLLAGGYVAMLLGAMGQKEFFLDLVSGLISRQRAKPESSVAQASAAI
jgi:O-antigen/teichoic acid export membrane protein